MPLQWSPANIQAFQFNCPLWTRSCDVHHHAEDEDDNNVDWDDDSGDYVDEMIQMWINIWVEKETNTDVSDRLSLLIKSQPMNWTAPIAMKSTAMQPN